MTDVIHHEDAGNTGLIVVLIIIVLAIGAFLLWRFLPAKQTNSTQEPGINVNLNAGGGSGDSNSGGSGY